VFTGDNPKLTAFLSGQARERDGVFNTDYKRRRTLGKEENEGPDYNNLKHKEDINADAE